MVNFHTVLSLLALHLSVAVSAPFPGGSPKSMDMSNPDKM